MIQAFNALLECMVTGLFCALFLVLFSRIGLLPLTLMVSIGELEEVEDDDNPTH